MADFNPAAAQARCEAIVGARRARSQLMTDDPKLTLAYLALTDLPAALKALEEAQGKLKALTGLYIKHNAGGHYKDDRSCAACQRDRILKGE